ncbi:GPO family capsid scaffolding protein [Stenotrophomonas sp. MMGLT7]|uniref:GPO family capsid scaffolding protein n=1 Tax=Stenotrophomonas sp. MMGLT7 TaxID=2901227 RepID=UPI001E2D9B8F|nr:GPO family capsid scaffolding protein [Stenotrophomonas sp. MMGLT7]MCD7096997.1 GPO family capsid scaffolding protein [Stenotrophomonas sp. MMGLT7]
MSTKTGTKAKKFRSKFFRVGVEGATVDGRTIDRKWIEEAAASYDPNTYGSRVWIEHIRSTSAGEDALFPPVGDVIALKAEEVTIAGQKKLALFAQIEPTSKLLNLVNKLRQKIYTSMELTPKFSDSGKAYLTGLGVTDTPASLGTEALVFSALRKQHEDKFYSAGEETEIEFEEVAEEPGAFDAFFSRLEKLLGKKSDPEHKPEPKGEPAHFTELAGLVQEFMQASQGETAALREAQAKTGTDLANLASAFNALKETLSQQPANPTQRPAATGGSGQALTDC